MARHFWGILALVWSCQENTSKATQPPQFAAAPGQRDPHDFGVEGEAKPPPPPEKPPLQPSKASEKRPSGIATEILKPGKGDRHPKEKDKVSVFFALWSKEGKLIEAPGTQPEYMEVAGMPGWIEGMKLMVVGEKRRIWIPAKLATIPGKGKETMGDVIVDIELLEILN